MLQKIIEIVAERARELIVSNPEIPSEFQGPALEEAGTVVSDEILSVLKSGNVGSILGMFKQFMSNESNSALLNNMTNRYSETLSGKFGLDVNSAQDLSSNVMPDVVSHLVRAVVDPKDERLSIQDLSSYVLSEVPQLRSLVQMVAESNSANGGSGLKDLAASALGGNGDMLESVLAGFMKGK